MPGRAWGRTSGGRTTTGPAFGAARASLSPLPGTWLERAREIETRHRGKETRTARQILLVRKDEQKAVFHLPVAQYPMQLLLCLVDTIPVLAIDDEDEALGARVVVSPERPDLVLAANVPDVELDILVGDGLDIESD